MSTTIAANTVATINGRRRRQRRCHRIRVQGSIAVPLKCAKGVPLPHAPVLTLARLGLIGQICRGAKGCRDGSALPSNFSATERRVGARRSQRRTAALRLRGTLLKRRLRPTQRDHDRPLS